jgi:hypothetical protein
VGNPTIAAEREVMSEDGWITLLQAACNQTGPTALLMLGLHAIIWQARRKIQTVLVGDKWLGHSHGMSTWQDFNSMEVPPYTSTTVQRPVQVSQNLEDEE